MIEHLLFLFRLINLPYIINVIMGVRAYAPFAVTIRICNKNYLLQKWIIFS